MRPDKLRLQRQEGHAADAAVETSLHRDKIIEDHLHLYSSLHPLMRQGGTEESSRQLRMVHDACPR